MWLFILSVILAGSFGSFTEYLYSRRKWNARSAVASLMIGPVMATAVVSYLYYKEGPPEDIPFHLIGISALAGYGHRKVWEAAVKIMGDKQ